MKSQKCEHCGKEVPLKIETSMSAHYGKCKIRLKKQKEMIDSIVTKEYLIEEYVNKGISAKYIAKILGVHVRIIDAKLKEFGISKRTLQEAKKLTHHIEISAETSMKRYGVKWNMLNKEIREKSKKTCLEKYGVENPFGDSEVQKKIKQTNFEKYGVEFVSKCQEIQDKIKQTNLKKFGVEFASQNEEIKEKVKKTCMEKYGVDNHTKHKDYKDKIRNIFAETGRLKTTELFKKEVYDLEGDDFIVLSDYISAKDNIKIQHVKCGHIFDILPNSFLCGNRCPKCKQSKGEHEIIKWFEKNKIDYYIQYKFSDCYDKRTLPFDFYLIDYDCCIEFDGWHHYNISRRSKDVYKNLELFISTLIHDKIKTEYCEKHNIKLIRIPYWELKNIDAILTTELAI